jgi:HK97 family phage major capsid protein
MTTTTNEQRERLTQRLDSITARAQTIFAEADDAGRDLTEVELGEVTRLASDADKLRARIDATAKLGASDDYLNQSAGRKIKPEITARSGIALGDSTAKRGTFANLFGAPSGRNEFRDLADFVRSAIIKDGRDPRLMNATMTEGVGSDGGFLLPVQYAQDLLDTAFESEIIRPRSTIIPMTSSSVSMPFFNTTDRSGRARAGLVMTMIGEGNTSTAQKAIVGNISMSAKKGAIFVDVSGELEADAPGFSQYLGAQMASAVAAGFDAYFVGGTGAGQPLGIVNAPCTVSVAKEGSQTADTIVEANILKMAARLHPSCWANSVWLVSPSALGQLFALTQAAGPSTGGRAVELVDRDGTLRLMTRPVLVTDACNALGDKGDIVLADLSRYLIGLRRDISLERTVSDGWKEYLTSFRTVVRFDGQPAWPTAVTPRAGADTLSAFVTLAERA